MMPTRLMIADDHPLIRLGLRHLLEDQANWKVVAEAADGRDAVVKAHETKPDVAILDIAMRRGRFTSELPCTKVLILSMHETDNIFKKVLAAGSRG